MVYSFMFVFTILSYHDHCNVPRREEWRETVSTHSANIAPRHSSKEITLVRASIENLKTELSMQRKHNSDTNHTCFRYMYAITCACLACTHPTDCAVRYTSGKTLLLTSCFRFISSCWKQQRKPKGVEMKESRKEAKTQRQK